MNSFSDPLLSSTHSDRLHYATGELLGADDFRDEQTYHRRQLARALLHLHGSGAIAGLRVVHVHKPGLDSASNEVELQVEPGLALDQAGRLVEVPVDACLRLRRWYEFIEKNAPAGKGLNAGNLRESWRPEGGGAVVADVFLAFHLCPRGYTPAFASGPFDALDASQPSRVRDGYELSLVLRKADGPIPVRPDPWAAIEGGSFEKRLAAAKDASMKMWHRDFQIVPENPPGVEPTAVLLARLHLPAKKHSSAAHAPDPDWSAAAWQGELKNVDNRVRHVVLPPEAVHRLLAP